MSEYIVILITAPNIEVAKKLGKALVEEKIAACVNIIPGLTSYYWWNEKVQEDNEVLIIAKTLHEKVRPLIEKVNDLHPYQVPEIIALEIVEGSKDYLNWITRTLT